MTTQYIGDGQVESSTSFPDTPEGNQRRWVAEIAMAEKEQREWWNQGEKVVKRYLDQRDAVDAADRRFNLFPTNVQIMEAALYEHAPTPEVSRSFSDPDDDVGRVAAEIIERAISQDLDVAYSDFGRVMKLAVNDWLVPGIGVAWLRLHVETATQNDPTLQADYEVIEHETVVIEHVHWKDLVWSPCRIWEDRRWVGRRVHMLKTQVEKRFGEDKTKLVSFRSTKANSDPNDPQNELMQKAEIYEIWDREKKHVWWINKGMSEVLDDLDDPLKLVTFEPMPKPLFALQSTSSVIPRPDYVMCQDQYQELDTLNNRISLLVQACKVVGVYDRANDGVKRLMTEGFDNQLIPVDNWAMFAEKGGLKGVIDWLPLEEVTSALTQLNMARDVIKAQIYEITGISDIVRGATKASETLGAQEMKAKFASIRIQSRQQEVAQFASEILRIKAEIMLKHMQFDTVLKSSGVEYLNEDPQLVQQAIGLIKNIQEFEWRVNIQSDSMAQIDMAQEKQERTELLNIMGNFFGNAVPVMEQAPDMLPIAVALIKFVIAGYRAGKGVEAVMDRTLDGMMKEYAQKKANPPPPQPDPAMVKAQAEVKAIGMKTQAGIQASNAKTQNDIALARAKAGADVQTKRLQLVHDARHKEDMHRVNVAATTQDQMLKAQSQHFDQMQERAQLEHSARLQDQQQQHDQTLAQQGQVHDQALADQGQDHDQGLQDDGQKHDQKLSDQQAKSESSGTSPEMKAMMAAISQMAKSIDKMAATISAPKKIVRDSTGRAVGMESR
jgi:hypothetical protein